MDMENQLEVLLFLLYSVSLMLVQKLKMIIRPEIVDEDIKCLHFVVLS